MDEIRNLPKPAPIKNKKRKTFQIILLVILLLTAVILVLFHKMIFKIEIVASSYKGADYLNTQEVSKKNIKYIGTSFFNTDVLQIEKEISELSTFILESNVRKSFPNRLDIEIKEREPFLNISTDRFFVIVDKGGYVMSVEERVDKTITAETSSLDDTITAKNILVSSNKLYSRVPLLIANEIKSDFKAGSQSTFFDTEKIYLINKVFNDKGYTIEEIVYINQIYEFKLKGGQIIKFSSAQDLEIQLKRFILVERTLKDEGQEFKTLDTRYERPVITR